MPPTANVQPSYPIPSPANVTAASLGRRVGGHNSVRGIMPASSRQRRRSGRNAGFERLDGQVHPDDARGGNHDLVSRAAKRLGHDARRRASRLEAALSPVAAFALPEFDDDGTRSTVAAAIQMCARYPDGRRAKHVAGEYARARARLVRNDERQVETLGIGSKASVHPGSRKNRVPWQRRRSEHRGNGEGRRSLARNGTAPSGAPNPTSISCSVISFLLVEYGFASVETRSHGYRSAVESGALGQSKHRVCTLNGLTCCAFSQVVDSAHRNKHARAFVDGEARYERCSCPQPPRS